MLATVRNAFLDAHRLAGMARRHGSEKRTFDPADGERVLTFSVMCHRTPRATIGLVTGGLSFAVTR